MSMVSDLYWFSDHYLELYNTYGKCYLIIKDESIHGAYDDMRTAVDVAWSLFEPGTVSIKECNGEDPLIPIILDGISPA